MEESLVSANSRSVHFFERGQQSLGSITSLVLRHHKLIHLVGEGGAGHAELHSAALIKDDSQILHKVLNVEAWLEVSPQHPWTKLLHREAASRTL